MSPKLLLPLCIMLASSAPAWAGNFQASPVRVTLDARAQSAVITLVNRGDGPVSLQLDAHRWSESEAGEALLEPTEDIVVFPSLLTLAVGETKIVRVGTTRPPETRERTYRLIVEELPDESRAHRGVAIRTRVSLPIFVASGEAKADPRIEGITLDAARRLHVRLANDGARHVKTSALLIAGARDGRAPIEARVAGWYLLAGQRREHVIALPADAGCVRSIEARLVIDDRIVERAEAITDPACEARR
ncbi:MAG: molecular chaperone [Deltaproteobacteria bacterium]|nr:molecular chaperone [Deltaproteobacteria bacterium]